ncbi:carboxypeptidase-like regulatory domain-containing protein [Edaphobacter modestus]|uniref:Carboxypeptidase family protein n=1 Tax=Edaphobacter modestus TaxID=388466 RepID=A0A4Q7Z065_9BACT|nr:carboxypeptidase-like regulatory domain-containing protein [Edaphobacter modestus]RZU43478.1 carboxypeptidase family protein [Edaphobacter modestus]
MSVPALRIYLAAAVMVMMALSLGAQTPARQVHLSGVVSDIAGDPVAGATVYVRAGFQETQTTSDSSGRYDLVVPTGTAKIEVAIGQQSFFRIALDIEDNRELNVTLRSGETVTVRADQDALTPDPATLGYSHTELLDANPGRPGVPVSVPGYPTETASGGIKAPQYFAPGVAGDHGEPVAQFFGIGNFLFQNNLTANAHGNGYADPNFIIGSTVGGVVIDNAGYNARYGDHSINLAVTYAIRNRIPTFVQMITDGRDGGFSAGWAPRDDRKKAWIAAEGLWGNGFLRRAEERQQYKVNALRAWDVGHHELTAYGIGYYGFSRLPGLIPIDTPVKDDTIDTRQADLTHTSIALIADDWQIAEKRSLMTGAYFRTYSLALRSNFGDGLIRQSEFRTVVGGSSTYSQSLSPNWLLLAGLELRREAPRGLDLARADEEGVFQPVTSNDLTITTTSPFAAVTGKPVRHVQVYLGLRRDQLAFDNRDLLSPANSFDRWPGVTSPKINVTFGEANAAVLPQVSFSFGKAFHANDPRIGTGSAQGDLLIQAREFQMVALKEVGRTELRLTLSKVTKSAQLAKIDADTGLQENVGPSTNQFLTLLARRRGSRGWWQVSWSQADARDRESGEPIPEAPRMIVDVVGGINRLPLGLDAKGEFEYVKAKPLGDGFNGIPVREIRLALNRSFVDGRWLLSLNGQLNNGYTGQTLETLAVGTETEAFERRVGVPLRSYGSVSLSYFFGR